MATQTLLTDKQLDILHDHYKETFARLREVEKTRDKLFLWVIALFALLSLEIGYPAAIDSSVEKITILGADINLDALPAAALLSITWVLTFALALRYCQATIWITRQYPYLHALEASISPLVGGGDLYQREGKVYLSDYPVLLDVAWIAYAFVFPLILMFAAGGLAYWEWTNVSYALPHRVFDCCIAGALIFFFFLYRVHPALIFLWRKLRALEKRIRHVFNPIVTASEKDQIH